MRHLKMISHSSAIHKWELQLAPETVKKAARDHACCDGIDRDTPETRRERISPAPSLARHGHPVGLLLPAVHQGLSCRSLQHDMAHDCCVLAVVIIAVCGDCRCSADGGLRFFSNVAERCVIPVSWRFSHFREMSADNDCVVGDISRSWLLFM